MEEYVDIKCIVDQFGGRTYTIEVSNSGDSEHVATHAALEIKKILKTLKEED